MSTIAQNRFTGTLNEVAADVRKNTGWFIALGIIQMIVGGLAVSFSLSATMASVATLGVLLLIASPKVRHLPNSRHRIRSVIGADDVCASVFYASGSGFPE